MNLRKPSGLTLLEMILVLVIVAIGAALAFAKMQDGIENQRAKKALETLRSISNAVRLYELNTNTPSPLGQLGQETPHVLESTGYLSPTEYAPFYTYEIIGASPAVMTATRADPDRTITLSQNGAVKGQDNPPVDTGEFLGPLS